MSRVVMGSWRVLVPPARVTRIPPLLVPRLGTYTTAPSARGGEGNEDPE